MSPVPLAVGERPEASVDSTQAAPLYVVGIGASAGGLEALEHFFDNVPRRTGMAFVVIQHLSPDFKSLMDEILARRTPLPISLVAQHTRMELVEALYLLPDFRRRVEQEPRISVSTDGD